MSPPTRYTCEETFRRLDDYVDRALSQEEVRRVEEHLKHCVECAGEYRFEESVISNVREKLKRIEVPPSLTDKISEKLAEQAGDPGP